MSAANSFNVLVITSPAFILIGLGYLSVKAGWLQKQGVQALGWFLTRIALPAVIFQALSSRRLQEILHLDFLLLYAGGSLIAFCAIFGIAKTIRKKTLTEAAFFGLGVSLSNTILIGYPIIVALFGAVAVVPFALALMVENLLILPLSLALAETGKQSGTHFLRAFAQALWLLLKNPIFIAIAAGIVSAAFSLTLPSIATSVISSLAATVSGLAQFTIGGILAGATIKVMNKDMGLVVVGKLLIHPAAVILMLLILPAIDPTYASIAIILACLPMFSIYAVLGMEYGMSEFCSAIMLLTTVISFITINITIWLLTTTFNLI